MYTIREVHHGIIIRELPAGALLQESSSLSDLRRGPCPLARANALPTLPLSSMRRLRKRSGRLGKRFPNSLIWSAAFVAALDCGALPRLQDAPSKAATNAALQ